MLDQLTFAGNGMAPSFLLRKEIRQPFIGATISTSLFVSWLCRIIGGIVEIFLLKLILSTRECICNFAETHPYLFRILLSFHEASASLSMLYSYYFLPFWSTSFLRPKRHDVLCHREQIPQN